MANVKYYDVILKPVVTEKSNQAGRKNRFAHHRRRTGENRDYGTGKFHVEPGGYKAGNYL